MLPFLFAPWTASSQSSKPLQHSEATGASVVEKPISGDCVMSFTAPDTKTTACVKLGDIGPDALPLMLQIEVHSKDGRAILITPGGQIKESHFWQDGRQIAISFIGTHARRADALYDTETGLLIEKIDQEPLDRSELPEWAKGEAERDDESVPESKALNAERTKWVAKVIRQIEVIQPGMKRKDLDAFFTMDGGMMSWNEQRYISKECPLIKVNVRFKVPDEERKGHWEDPEDVIESVSKPYLDWPIED
jgi:hypothetical protein